MTIKKNQRLIATISAWAENGHGVATIDGVDIMVPYTAVGDTVEVHITKVFVDRSRAGTAHSKAYARIVNIQTPSPYREEVPCPVFGKCGGCQLQHLNYDVQLQYKEDQLSRCFERYKLTLPSPTVFAANDPLHYRNRAQYAIRRSDDDRVVIGLSAPRSQRIIPIQTCYIQSNISNTVLSAIYTLFEQFDLPVFEQENTAGLANVLIRYSESSKTCLLAFSGNVTDPPFNDDLLAYVAGVPEIAGMFYSYNPSPEWTVLGGSVDLLYGEETLSETVLGTAFKLNVGSFFQSNVDQLSVLLNRLKEGLLLGPETVVWDLYCGSGAISLSLAPYCQHVVGVESDPKSIELAKENAVANLCKNTTFLAGDVADCFGQIQNPCDSLIVDPPRKGLDKNVIKSILEIAPAKLVYVSCNPETLARDLQLLTVESGYVIDSVDIVDMFPHTYHFEVLVFLEWLD